MNKLAIVFISTVAVIAGGNAAMAEGPKSASEFLTNAMKGDNSEMKLGQLAADKGQSAGTKKFGQTLVTDHAKAKQQVANLDRSMGVSPTNEMMPEAETEYSKLQSMSGASFDHEFASYMVDDHKKDISDFEAQTKATNQTAGLAKKQLPTLRKHLKLAKSLDGG